MSSVADVQLCDHPPSLSPRKVSAVLLRFAAVASVMAVTAHLVGAQAGGVGPVATDDGFFRDTAGTVARTGADRTALQSPAQSRCVVDPAVEVRPQSVELGAEATVTATVQADCSMVQVPFNAVLVYDNSVAMGGTRMNYLRESVGAFADAVDLSQSRVGLIKYNFAAEILAHLTDNPDELREAARHFFPEAGSNLVMGIRAARLVLEEGAADAPPGTESVMILLVGSENDTGPEDVIAEADLAKAAGMTIVTVAAAGTADGDMLETIASSSSHYHTETTASRLSNLLRGIASDIGTVSLTGATATMGLTEGIAYAFGSGFPVPRVSGRTLTWQFNIWPDDGMTLVFGVVPSVLGTVPLADSAMVSLSFDRGSPEVVALPIPSIEVVEGPTLTPLPATETPTATPTPRTQKVYLPLLWQKHCLAPAGGMDLVLALGATADLMQPRPEGGRALDDAMRAAAALIDSLRLDDPVAADRVAVIAFAERPRLLSGLSRNRGALISSLGRLYDSVGYASNVAPALQMAQDLGAPSRSRAVIVLTARADDAAAATELSGRLRATGVSIAGVALSGNPFLGAPDRIVWVSQSTEFDAALADAYSLSICDLRR